jgi:hypothetical protein
MHAGTLHKGQVRHPHTLQRYDSAAYIQNSPPRPPHAERQYYTLVVTWERCVAVLRTNRRHPQPPPPPCPATGAAPTHTHWQLNRLHEKTQTTGLATASTLHTQTRLHGPGGSKTRQPWELSAALNPSHAAQPCSHKILQPWEPSATLNPSRAGKPCSHAAQPLARVHPSHFAEPQSHCKTPATLLNPSQGQPQQHC